MLEKRIKAKKYQMEKEKDLGEEIILKLIELESKIKFLKRGDNNDGDELSNSLLCQ